MKHATLLNDMHEKLFGTRPFAVPIKQSVGTGYTQTISARVELELKQAYLDNADGDDIREALKTYAVLKGWL